MSPIPLAQVFLVSVLTLFCLKRLLSFFREHKNPLFLILLTSASALLWQKDWLLALPYFDLAGPILFFAITLFLIFRREFNHWIGSKKSSVDLFFRNGSLDELVKACEVLSQTRTGALMAIERDELLSPYIHKSVTIDAKIRHELLLTIFTPPTYLHDGGAILRGERIVSCSAIFPLSENPKIKKDLGTRHRAALGMSEDNDALCLVVSEETGLISITDRGRLFYGVEQAELRDILRKLLRFKKIKKQNYLETLADGH